MLRETNTRPTAVEFLGFLGLIQQRNNRSVIVSTKRIAVLLSVEMGKVSKLSDKEREIGARLAGVRGKLLISQTAFALKAGIGRERLATYELGYVALPWQIGDRICRLFDINSQWLVEGVGPKHPYLRPVHVAEVEITPRELFSTVYEREIKPFFNKILTERDPDKLARLLLGERLKDHETLKRLLLLIGYALDELPHDYTDQARRELVSIFSRALGKILEMDLQLFKSEEQSAPAPPHGWK
jgi:transcriptional regulator with XRE-family HTH domain